MYRKNANGWLKHIDFMILDMICLQLAFIMAYFIKNGNIHLYNNFLYRNMAIILELADLIVLPKEIAYPNTLIEQLTLAGITVHMNLAKVVNSPGKKQFVEKIGDYTVLTTSINYASLNELFLKRVFDIICGALGCILTLVICIFIGPAIYIASPGPIFFSQERVGKNGKKFKMYKFRSMYLDAEERKAELMKDNKLGDGKMFKLDFDPRVIGNKVMPDGSHKTGIGEFIRKTSLDEFPQFFNVLKGDMSIVGVRDIIGTTRENSSIYAACVA